MIALHSVLHEGAAQRYDEEHARIPEELDASFARVGITQWQIWRSGDRLFHLVECEDFDRAMLELSADPANQRWQARIGAVVKEFYGPDGQPAMQPLLPVWALTAQREAQPRNDEGR